MNSTEQTLQLVLLERVRLRVDLDGDEAPAYLNVSRSHLSRITANGLVEAHEIAPRRRVWPFKSLRRHRCGEAPAPSARSGAEEPAQASEACGDLESA